MKKPNLLLLAGLGGAGGLIGFAMVRTTKGGALEGFVLAACALAILAFAGYVVWLLLYKNKATVKASPIEKEAAVQFKPEPGQGVIYLYRHQYVGMLAGLDVILDGHFVGQTRGYCFYRLVVTPGTHVLTGAKNCQGALSIDVAAGEIAYVEQSILMGPIKGGYGNEIAYDIKKAQAAMRKSKLLLPSA